MRGACRQLADTLDGCSGSTPSTALEHFEKKIWPNSELDGHHFLTMECVDGEDLATLLARIGACPRPRRWRLHKNFVPVSLRCTLRMNSPGLETSQGDDRRSGPRALACGNCASRSRVSSASFAVENVGTEMNAECAEIASQHYFNMRGR